MGWLRLVGSLKLQVSFAEYRLFSRALLQKKPIILRSLLIVATPSMDIPSACHSMHYHTHTCVTACITTHTQTYRSKGGREALWTQRKKIRPALLHRFVRRKVQSGAEKWAKSRCARPRIEPSVEALLLDHCSPRLEKSLEIATRVCLLHGLERVEGMQQKWDWGSC